MPRTLLPGQHAELRVVDVTTGEHRLVFSSSTLLFEAPNWTSDGHWLVVNGDGQLFRIPAAGGEELEQIDLGGVPPINNDHVLSPDGTTVYVSADDGHLYAVPMAGGSSRRVTNDRGPGFHHYLHGISPDGGTLAYIGLENLADGRRITNVYTIPSAGGQDVQITNDEHADDGSEYGPDGKWIYFNSERASTAPGHAQLFRISGRRMEQLTHDERVNWFPHPAPDGSTVAYVSFPPGTMGHPADVDDVRLRLLEADGKIRELATVFGGQGTMNVPSWSPTSTQFAYVTYPIATI
jgi:Tol biopolymer transport system component